MRKKRRIRKAASMIILFSMVLALLGGCGQDSTENGSTALATNSTDSATGTGTEKTDTDNSGGSSQDTGGQAADGQAMGRYVEEVTDLSERISGWRNRIFRMPDGSLIISNGNKPFLVSRDNGETWEEERRAWLDKLEEKDSYIVDMAIGADSTIAIVIGEMDENGEYGQRLLIIKPDGTELPIETQSIGNGRYPQTVGVTDTGRVFVAMSGSDNLYEIKEDGSSELCLTLPGGGPNAMQFHDNLLIMDGSSYDTLLLYDMEKEEYITDDETLKDFIKGYYYGGNKFNMDDGFEMYFFMSEDNVLYLAGDKGLHRHVLGGSAMEQVIDGSLCTLSNPSYRLEGMVMLDNNEFLALFGGARLVHFVYDPDIPTVPDNMVKVYSLKENTTIQQAVALYQAANPEVLVQYEVGIAEGSSITRDDALKSLNTKIMAGEGPDVLILDDMPLDSYIEKGLLLDMSTLIGSMNGDNALFGNIVDAMKTGDKLYAMPCEIWIPIIAGEEKYIAQMKDLEGIADGMEELRQDNPEKDLLMIASTKGIMRLFSMTCVPAWITESGEIDKEAVGEFLEQTKRIYDAQLDGLPQANIDRYNRANENWMEEFGETRDNSKYLRTGAGAMFYVSQYTQINCGALDGFNAYAETCSINKVSGYENTVWSVMNGQSSNVFCTNTLLGINAASKHPEYAEDFIRACLGKENQAEIWTGLPVNQAAFEQIFVPDDRVDENGAFSWEGMGTPEGEQASFVSYWPDDKQKEELRKCIEAADTPYIEDRMLESAVYEEGGQYLQGMRSLDETLRAIEKRIALYMAE
ncbi:MAG: carbohydrate ABC transporter substrate-binding protein [Lachnospiraceae bacterium]|nr:carbohydrate ABC transporter substrate-binding protein [Lachnospiraceae bacterium]